MPQCTKYIYWLTAGKSSYFPLVAALALSYFAISIPVRLYLPLTSTTIFGLPSTYLMDGRQY